MLSEGAASLLSGVDRAAVLWRIDLDSAGLPVEVDVERALVQSRAKLAYAEMLEMNRQYPTFGASSADDALTYFGT